MKSTAFIVPFLFIFSLCPAQDKDQELLGAVSFVTSNNVYVKFDSTEEIQVGDILRLSGKDCLKVTDKSSVSIVCSIMDDCAVNKGDLVSFRRPSKEVKVEPVPLVVAIEPEPDDKIPEESKASLYTENIRGRVSASSYNLFSNVRDDRHRFMTNFSLDANHIGDSKFSVQTYFNYRNLMGTTSSYTGRTSILNVFNLNLRYDATPDLVVVGGRAINPKASSLGANDGVMAEKYFGNFYVGAIGGFRPDIYDYGFNSDLLQYGGYVGIETTSEEIFSQTTAGLMEQSNAGNTDRRYVYLQHSSQISDLNLFGTMELDIFSKTGNNSRLTNLYLSARYRFSRAVNLMVSYDARKRIIYYESYDSMIDQLLDDDLARQGVRMRLNVRPAKIVWLGASYSNRFQSDDQNKSDNIYAYATVSKIPSIGGRINLSYNLNNSNYLASNILSVRYSREFFENNLSSEVYYRIANYTYENSLLGDFTQDFYGLNLSYRLSRTWQLSVLGEYSQFEAENTYRFYTRLIKRFYSKKKKR